MKTEHNDRLEKFVKDNRQQFDAKEPSGKVWKGIESNLQLTSRKNTSWFWKAAAILFFMSSGYLFYVNQSLLNKQEQSNEHALAEEVDDDFNSTESYYISLISEKKDQIYDYSRKDLEVEGMYAVDLEQLDAMYQVLKEQYSKSPSKELQDAMTLNLIVRIDILNQQLSDIEGVKKQKESSDIGV